MTNTTPAETDVFIVGAGPVGLFTIFECGMLRLKCHVADVLDRVGGQCAALYPEKPIYDIPAHPHIMAADLVDRLAEQAMPFKPVFHLNSQVTDVQKNNDGRWLVRLSTGGAVLAHAVIIAAGVGAFGPNRPPLDSIETYENGGGVNYLVTRQEDFRDQRIVIAGGGDSAVDWALSLVDVAAHVSVVHRRPKFRAAPESEARLKALAAEGRLDLVVPYQLHGLEGDGKKLEAVIVATLAGETKRLPADALLPFYGLSTNLGPIADWNLDSDGATIPVRQQDCATCQPGIFAIGDIASYPGKLKLILTGFAEAAHAAHAARAIARPNEEFHFEHSTTSGVRG